MYIEHARRMTVSIHPLDVPEGGNYRAVIDETPKKNGLIRVQDGILMVIIDCIHLYKAILSFPTTSIRCATGFGNH